MQQFDPKLKRRIKASRRARKAERKKTARLFRAIGLTKAGYLALVRETEAWGYMKREEAVDLVRRALKGESKPYWRVLDYQGQAAAARAEQRAGA